MHSRHVSKQRNGNMIFHQNNISVLVLEYVPHSFSGNVGNSIRKTQVENSVNSTGFQYTVCHLSNNSHFPEFPLTSMRGVLYASAPPGDGCRGGCQGCDRASLWRVGLISMKQDSRYTCAAHVVG